MLAYQPVYSPFKHGFLGKITYIKHVDPLVAHQVFMYLIRKDFERLSSFMKVFLPESCMSYE